MRRLDEPDIERFRVPVMGMIGDQNEGAFLLPPLTDLVIRVIASSGFQWDHVSVSCETRCPTWEEMEYVINLFSFPTETWMQLHVPTQEHINFHPYTLHWWRPRSRKIPRPPNSLVGAGGGKDPF